MHIVSSELINLNRDELNVPLSPVGSLKAHIDERTKYRGKRLHH